MKTDVEMLDEFINEEIKKITDSKIRFEVQHVWITAMQKLNTKKIDELSMMQQLVRKTIFE